MREFHPVEMEQKLQPALRQPPEVSRVSWKAWTVALIRWKRAPAPPPAAAQRKRSDATLRVSSTMGWCGAAKPGRALPFQHANLDVVTPPRGHAIFRVQKKTPGNQLCQPWCLDASRGHRVSRTGFSLSGFSNSIQRRQAEARPTQRGVNGCAIW